MRLPRAFLLGLALAGLSAAQDQPPKSFLHRALLDRSPVIVRATLDRDREENARAFQATPFLVKTILAGAAENRFLVRTPSERLAAHRDLDKLLFLAPTKSAAILDLVDVVDLPKSEAETIVGYVQEYLAMPALLAPSERFRSLSGLAWKGLETKTVLGTRTGLRELEGLLGESPHLFSIFDPARLAGFASSIPAEDRALYQVQRRRLDAAAYGAFLPWVRSLDADAVRVEVGRVDGFRRARDDAARLAWLEQVVVDLGFRARLLVEGAVGEGNAAVRSRAAWWLGELGDPESAPVLRDGFSGTDGLERLQRIEALGKIGDPESVPLLVGMLKDRSLVEEVVLALARIGTADAQDELDRFGREVQRAGPAHPARAVLARVLSESFARDEAKRRSLQKERHAR